MINDWERFFETGKVVDYLSAKRTEAAFLERAGISEKDGCKNQFNAFDAKDEKNMPDGADRIG